MRGLFVTENSAADTVAGLVAKIGTNFDKVAVQDTLPAAQDLIAELNGRNVSTSVWTASPDDTARLALFGARQIIVQAEDYQADAAVLNVAALRLHRFSGLISVVTNLWPSRNLTWFDAFMHDNSVRLLVECYVPENPNQTVAAMLAEAHSRSYPHAEPVLGCYRGFALASYAPLPARYWIWDAAQMAPGDWER